MSERRSYSEREKQLAAYLAGCGLPASEIADKLGDTTTQRVSALLSHMDIPLDFKGPHDRVTKVLIKARALQFITRIAQRHEVEPKAFFGFLMEEAYADAEMVARALKKAGARD